MTSVVLGDSTLESLIPSLKAPLLYVCPGRGSFSGNWKIWVFFFPFTNPIMEVSTLHIMVGSNSSTFGSLPH